MLLPGVGKFVQHYVVWEHQHCIRFQPTCCNSPWSDEGDFSV